MGDFLQRAYVGAQGRVPGSERAARHRLWGGRRARQSTALLPVFDAWRTGDADGKAIRAAAGTLDWIFAEYRADRRFTKLDPKTRRNHEVGFALVGGHVLIEGPRLGEVRLTVITTAVTRVLL